MPKKENWIKAVIPVSSPLFSMTAVVLILHCFYCLYNVIVLLFFLVYYIAYYVGIIIQISYLGL